MKYIFHGICLPVKKIPENPQLIQTAYKNVSDSIGFELVPNQQTIKNMINYCEQMDQLNSRDYLMRYLYELYPETKHAEKQIEENK